MKRQLTGIAAAALALGMMAPAAFAATTTSTVHGQGSITVNGTTVSQPFIRVGMDSGNQTSFIGVWYLGQAVKAAGGTYTWDYATKTFNMNIPGVDASKLSVSGGVGTGNTTIQINGVTVKMVNSYAWQDPAGGKSDITTFVPLYYIGNVFAALGDGASWNGTTFGFKTFNVNATSFTTKQTAASKVEVDFNGTVASGTSVTLSQNGVNYAVTPTWSSDMKSVVLDTGYNLAAGTYTVTAGTMTGTVTIATAVPSSISIATKSLAANGSAALAYTVKDQFGNAVTNPGNMTVNAYDTTTAAANPIGVSGVTATGATLALGSAAKGDSVVVTVADSSYAITATATIPVAGPTNVATLALGAASDNGSSSISPGPGIDLSYTATDAYGNSVTLPQGSANSSGQLDGFQFLSSNPSVISASTFAVDTNGVLSFTAAGTGTTTITVVNLSTGQSTTKSLTVASSTGVGSFMMSQPSAMVIAGQATTVPYTATDAFGNAITQANFTSSYSGNVTFGTSNTNILPTSDVKFDALTNALEVTPQGSGTVTLYAYVGGTLQNSITLNVNAAAVPYAITANDITPDFVNGASYTFTASDFTIKNQYGQTYTPQTGDTLTSTETGTGFTLAANALTANANTGTEAVTVTFTQPTSALNGNQAQTVTYTFNVNAIASTAVSSYKLAVGSDNNTVYADTAATTSTWDMTPSLTGLDGSTAVTLASNPIAYVTSSNPAAATIVNGAVHGVAAGTSTITAFDANGNQLAATNVTVSTATPVATTVSFADQSVTVAAGQTGVTLTTLNNSNEFTNQDQYGVNVSGGYWTSSNSTNVKVDPTNGNITATGATGTSAVVTYIAPNGKSASIDVYVQ
ncbi:hypothetical protein JZ785_20135 [Alicyclobacillus curvatus]|nr:hypothetical protein JZ785_20135 [Alicyclobacillus curvatus]